MIQLIYMLSLSSQSCIRLNYYSLCNFDRCIMPSWRYWKEFINVHKLQTMVRWFRICKFYQIDTRIRCNTRNILGKTYLVRLFSACFYFYFSKFRGPQQCDNRFGKCFQLSDFKKTESNFHCANQKNKKQVFDVFSIYFMFWIAFKKIKIKIKNSWVAFL